MLLLQVRLLCARSVSAPRGVGKTHPMHAEFKSQKQITKGPFFIGQETSFFGVQILSLLVRRGSAGVYAHLPTSRKVHMHQFFRSTECGVCHGTDCCIRPLILAA